MHHLGILEENSRFWVQNPMCDFFGTFFDTFFLLFFDLFLILRQTQHCPCGKINERISLNTPGKLKAKGPLAALNVELAALEIGTLALHDPALRKELGQAAMKLAAGVVASVFEKKTLKFIFFAQR